MKKYYLLVFLICSKLVGDSLWIDEEVLQQSIKTNPQDIQSRVIYARYLLEQDEYLKATEVLEGLDSKTHPSVEKLRNDIKLSESDKSYLQNLGIDRQSALTKVPTVASQLSLKDSERLYYALQRSNIPIDVSSMRILGQKIAQNGNSILAGTILSDLPDIEEENIQKGVAIEVVEEKNFTPPSKPIKLESLETQLAKALKLYSTNPSMKNIETVLYLYEKSGKTQEQIPFLKTHVQTHPFDYDARLHVGKLLAWEGEYESALDYLYSIEGKNKNSAQLLIGQIYGWQGKYSQAKPILEKVAKNGTDSERYDADKTLAYLARWQGDHATARDIFADLHRKNPSDEEVEEEVLFDEKQYSILISKYESILRKNPNDVKSIERIATLLSLNNETEKAIFYFEKQYALTNNPNILKEMGNVALKAKETQRGLEYWHNYAKIVDTPAGWLEYSKNLYWNGRYQEALDILHKIQNNPTVSDEAKELIALIESQATADTATTSATEEKIELTSYSQEAEFAEKMRLDGKYDEAARMYRLLYLRTSDPHYGKLYAQSLYDSGKVEEANAIKDILSIEEPFSASTPVKKKTPIDTSSTQDTSTQKDVPGIAKVGIEGERLTDVYNLNASAYRVVGEYTTSSQITLHGEVGKYALSNQTDSMSGNSAFAWIGNSFIKGGAYVDTIEGKADVNPYMMITYPIASHSVSLTAHRRNTGLIKNAIKPLHDENTLTMIALSDYVLFPDNDEFWGSMEMAWDERGNQIFTPQFQYRFLQLPMEWLTWSLSLDGWYSFNSKPTSDYYSPAFADGTYLQNLIEIPVYEKISFSLMGGLGYSYEGSTMLYKIGAWLERPLSDSISFRAGCAEYQSMNAAAGSLPYAYDMCDAKLLYSW